MIDTVRICRGCGCSDRAACPGGCGWVLLDVETPSGICSRCAELMKWDLHFMARFICSDAMELLSKLEVA